MSLMLIRFPLPEENVSVASSFTLCAPGTELTGASLTALTVMFAAAVLLLKAVIPPLLVVLAVLPTAPLVWSQARKVMLAETLPLKFALWTKLTRVDALAAS